MADISIHALLAESDFTGSAWVPEFPISIHALLAESDSGSVASTPSGRDFYPRSPCGERRGRFFRRSGGTHISIHALLAESDLLILSSSTSIPIFLSTLSLRRATQRTQAGSRHNTAFLSTLSLRRATPTTSRSNKNNMISIHALLAESDP